MFRDDGEKLQIFFTIIQEGMSASLGVVVNSSRNEYFFLAVAEGDAFSGGNEDYLAGGFVAMLADGMAGARQPKSILLSPSAFI